MTTSNKVAVAIPAWNCEAFLARAIDSALAQEYAPKEIWVVDDGSTDGTADVARRYGDRIRYLRQENAGPDVARNRVIFESDAEYIAFLDADDEWLPGRLSQCLAPMEADPTVGLTWCRSLQRFPDGHEIIYGEAIARNSPYPFAPLPPPLQSTPATTCRRSALVQVGGFRTNLLAFADYDLWRRVGEVAQTVAIVAPLVRIHVRPDSRSRRKDQRQVIACYESLMLGALAERPDLYGPRRRTIIARVALEWGNYHYAQGDVAAARRCFWQCLTHGPNAVVLRFFLTTLAPAPLRRAIKALASRRKQVDRHP